MNYVILNGYVQTKANYIQNEDGIKEYRFFISNRSKALNKTYAIPVKALGSMADELYANLKDTWYVEIIGELIRINAEKTFVLIKEISYTAPKSDNAYYVKSSEFLELFSPKKVLIRASKGKEDENKRDNG